MQVTISSWLRRRSDGRSERPDCRFDAKILVSVNCCGLCQEQSDKHEDELWEAGYHRVGPLPELDPPWSASIPHKCRLQFVPTVPMPTKELYLDFDTETILSDEFPGGLHLGEQAFTFSYSLYLDSAGQQQPVALRELAAEQCSVAALAARIAYEDDPDAQEIYEGGIGDICDIFAKDADSTWFDFVKAQADADEDFDYVDRLLMSEPLGDLLIFHGHGELEGLLTDPHDPTVDFLSNAELIELFRERLRRGQANPRCLMLACCKNNIRAGMLVAEPLGIEYVIYFEGGAINGFVVKFQKHFLLAVKERRRLFRGPLNYERAFCTAKRALEDELRTLRTIQVSISGVMEKLQCIRAPTARTGHSRGAAAAAALPGEG